MAIQYLIAFRSIIALLQLLSALTGAIGLGLSGRIPCNAAAERTDANKAILSILIISQFVDVAIQTCCCYLISTGEVIPFGENRFDEESQLSKWEERARRLLQRFSLNPEGNNPIHPDNRIEDIARIMTRLFHHDGFLDVVPSDVAAGLILVRIIQRSKRQNATERAKRRSTRTRQTTMNTLFLSSDDPRNPQVIYEEPLADPIADVHYTRHIALLPNGQLRPLRNHQAPTFELGFLRVSSTFEYAKDIDLLTVLVHYIKYAALIYSTIVPLRRELSIWTCLACHRCAGLPVTHHGLQLCCDCWLGSTGVTAGHPERSMGAAFVELSNRYERRGSPHLEAYYCAWNRSGINKHGTALKHTELIQYSQRNDMTHKPYAIFVDHAMQTVVLTIRGTVSIEDCITDILCDPVELEAAGRMWGFDGRGKYAHGGMLRAALAIRQEIQDTQILDQLLGRQSESGKEVDHPESVLQTPLFERFSHYCVVITGHSLGAGTAVLLAMLLRSRYPSVQCYAYGTPGAVLDRSTSVALRNDVLDAICRAKANKMVILSAICRDLKEEDVLYPESQIPQSHFRDKVTAFKRACEEKARTSPQVPLYHPGQILHMVRTQTRKRGFCGTAHNYELLATRPLFSLEEDEKKEAVDMAGANNIPGVEVLHEDLDDYKDICVSRTMVNDHLPDRYYATLQQVLFSYYRE
eukprot:scaffold487_cov178-Ochromonas_danica.AAC.26